MFRIWFLRFWFFGAIRHIGLMQRRSHAGGWRACLGPGKQDLLRAGGLVRRLRRGHHRKAGSTDGCISSKIKLLQKQAEKERSSESANDGTVLRLLDRQKNELIG